MNNAEIMQDVNPAPEAKIILAQRLTMQNQEQSKDFFDNLDSKIGHEVIVDFNVVSTQKGDVFVGYLYSDNKNKNDKYLESNKIATVSRTSDVSIDTAYGKTATNDDLKAFINYGYTATIVGKGQMGEAIIKLSAKVNNNVKKVKIAKIEAKKVIKELIDSGKLTKEEVDERILYLSSHNITEKDEMFSFILMAIWQHPDNAKVIKPKKLYINPNPKEESIIKRMLRNIILNDHVILEGAKACGKNVAWESISWLLNRPLEILNCDGKMTKASMFGSPTTDMTAKKDLNVDGAKEFINVFFSRLMGSLKGAFSLFFKKHVEVEDKDDTVDKAAEFLISTIKCASPDIVLEKGPITRALIDAHERGTILIIDEMNLSDPNTLAGALNALTDKHTKEYQINGIGKVVIPEGLIIGATQNGTGGEYIGTKKQNDATMSRWNCIRINAPTTILQILKNNPIDLEDRYFEMLDNIYQKFSRAAKVSRTVSESCLNVRGFERVLGHIAMGQDILDAVCECVINTCDAKDESILIEEAKGQIKD